MQENDTTTTLTFQPLPSDSRFHDLTAQSFSDVFVLGYAGKLKDGNHAWHCKCTCGKLFLRRSHHLKSKSLRSCGCYRVRKTRTHGCCPQTGGTPEYRAWEQIIQRCTNSSLKRAGDYIGRGITICPEWRNDFLAFYAHVGNRPTPEHSIDRIDNNGNYEPGNVRWATRTEQARNRRSNIIVTHQGQQMCLKEACLLMGLNYKKTWYRLKTLGWDLARALSA